MVTASRAYGITPWRSETFRFSTDPELVGEVTDICGLYLTPPENAIVLCVDDKAQNQALDRTPADPADAAGTDRATQPWISPPARSPPHSSQRHRNQEFQAFLEQVERAYRHAVDGDGQPVELHLVMDNCAAHEHADVTPWLADNPRFTVHVTPTHASWMNLVEVWFGIVESQAIRRGVCTSVTDLSATIRAFIDGWNHRSHRFVWTKTADEVLAKANREKTSYADH